MSAPPARIAALVLAQIACAGRSPPAGTHPAGPTPPVAARHLHDVHSPYGTRMDPYYWLRDDTRKDPKVLAHLEAEKTYAEAALAPVRPLEDDLVAEMRARLKEDDSTVPYLDDGYWYYTRYETGKQHPIHCRRKGMIDGPEEIVLDGNALATGHAFYKIADWAVSRDGRLVAWLDDTVGRRQHVLHVKDIATGALRPDTASNLGVMLVWANDNKTVFVLGKDPVTLREDRVLRVVLGGATHVAWQESDASFYVHLAKTKSRRYVQIRMDATTNTEIRLIDADRPDTAPRVFWPRERDHEYKLDHLDGRFAVLTNKGARNFRLVGIPDGKEREPTAWAELAPHRPDVLVEQVALYRTFLAASIRSGGMRKVEIRPAKGAPFVVDAPDAAYAMTLVDTPDATATRVRYVYEALTTPATVYELDVAGASREPILLKRTQVPTYDASLYRTEYVHAKAADGAQIPISVVYRMSTPRDGSAPLLVYAYGAYGLSQEPRFKSDVVSLLDRGWVYAIAHVRGGQELGRAWYEAGRQLAKKNTFTDFIAATEHLVGKRFGARDQVYAMGGSAGGLLVGAVLNMRPDLYRGAIALVPFVDVVTTMLDESIPLTTNEFDEWGNPKERAFHDYMLSYSPYDNVRAQGYPSLYVHSGLWDSQVQYYEPAKWVAKLRATRTDDNLLVFDIDMSSGHGGASGRFDRMRQVARYLAFLLHVRERPDTRPGWPGARGGTS